MIKIFRRIGTKVRIRWGTVLLAIWCLGLIYMGLQIAVWNFSVLTLAQ